MALSIERPEAHVEVDLWGTMYDLLPVTRSLETPLAEAGRKVTEVLTQEPEAGKEEAQADQLVEAVSAVLDLRLKPQNGARTKASKKILDAWKADKLSVDQILDFLEDLKDATDRPT